MKILPFILLIPLFLSAGTVSYGEDPFVLGMSIDAYALGNIKALPMANPSPGGNVAHVEAEKLKIGFQHTEGFGGVYQTDVISGNKDQWSFLIFRGGVGNIPDTRDALLDYGSDGVAGTNDADGTEDNGLMDPGERLSINSITYFSTQQFLAELGYSHLLRENLAVHGTARLLYTDLYAERGLGIGFHGGLLYEPFQKFRVGVEVTDVLTTTMFWSSGLTEVYAPQIYLGFDFRKGFDSVPFVFRPILQLELPLGNDKAQLNGDIWGYSGGLEIIFQDQLYIQLGQNSLDQFQLGALIRTQYMDIQYGTGFSDLSKIAGQTHRVGVGLKLDELKLF
ncbi:MAG: hypothetical protein K9N35_11510 [Candidatus Marinimicrobia bacterium]|nr:hypothetical protein [Candidatus Neomarinimicrobiota bacterium]